MVAGSKYAPLFSLVKLLYRWQLAIVTLVLIVLGYMHRDQLEKYIDQRTLIYVGAAVVALVIADMAFLSRTRKFFADEAIGERFRKSWRYRYYPFATGLETGILLMAVAANYFGWFDRVFTTFDAAAVFWLFVFAVGAGEFAKFLSKWTRKHNQTVESYGRGIAIAAVAYLCVLMGVWLDTSDSLLEKLMIVGAVALYVTWRTSDVFDEELTGVSRRLRQVDRRKQTVPVEEDQRHYEPDPAYADEDEAGIEDHESAGEETRAYMPGTPTEPMVSDTKALAEMLGRLNLSRNQADELLKPHDHNLDELARGSYSIAELERALTQLMTSNGAGSRS